jgi:hypothetical protein
MIDLDDLAPDSPGDAQEDTTLDSSEPVFTRTLAELYVKQGFTDRALDVYRHLLEREPDAEDLRDRIARIESGEAAALAAERNAARNADTDDPRVAKPDPPSERATPVAPAASGDVEEIARDLSEQEDADADVDSPFAWGAEDHPSVPQEDEDGSDAAGYFDSLLDWKARDEP